MQRLVDGLVERTRYDRLELVVVDNASTDGTQDWLTELEAPFPVRMEANESNRSFSEACNQGAGVAAGQLLLFANNDVEPIEPGWLHELVAAQQAGTTVVGATLLHADVTDVRAPSGWIVQHAGIRFRRDGNALRAYNAGDGDDAFGQHFGVERSQPSTTAACLLLPRVIFEAAGGFPVGYRYGTEDVDFGLQLRRMGHEIRVSGRSMLLHRESSSQKAAGREFMRLNRLGNRALFAQRWSASLRREVRLDRLRGARAWTDEPPHAAITLTSLAQSDGWGDWYTAHELGDALVQKGWQITYAERKDDHWYDLPADLDYLITLMDPFDARRVPTDVVTVAWIRNWTERWLERPWFNRIDLLLVSSGISGDLIAARTGRPSIPFPLATNPARFFPPPRNVRELDYVFTGNRWGVERDIERALRPRDGEQVAIYGRGWEDSPLAPFANGTAAYEELRKVYGWAKLVIDDTAAPTLPIGAVNARVFDALACGAPVITNCGSGVRELFDTEFPVWSSQASLRAQLDALLEDGDRRRELGRRYRRTVLNHHTYAHRADRLVEILEESEQKLSFAIKIGAPTWEAAARWGDLHFATALQRELQRRGHRSLIQVLAEWEDPAGLSCDVAIVLRGLSRHSPKPGQLNVLWNISHPEDLGGAECDGYDLVFVASPGFAADLSQRTSTPVVLLEQATDPRVFHPEPTELHRRDLVFVGNSRFVRRKVLADLLPTKHDLAVFGSNWNGLIEDGLVVAEWVASDEVRQVYSSAGIVLNDHWEDMRAHGFISNRVYDAVACGAVVISDRVAGLEEHFGDAVVTYDTPEELHAHVERLLADPEERRRRSAEGRFKVLAEHTFAHRVDVLLAAIADARASRGSLTRIAA